MTRETFAIATQMAAAIRAISTIYEYDESNGEKEYSPAEVDELASLVLKEVSPGMAGNMACFIDDVIKMSKKNPIGIYT